MFSSSPRVRSRMCPFAKVWLESTSGRVRVWSEFGSCKTTSWRTLKGCLFRKVPKLWDPEIFGKKSKKSVFALKKKEVPILLTVHHQILCKNNIDIPLLSAEGAGNGLSWTSWWRRGRRNLISHDGVQCEIAPETITWNRTEIFQEKSQPKPQFWDILMFFGSLKKIVFGDFC